MAWGTHHFKLFEIGAPRPEILLLGTGKVISQPPPGIRKHLNLLGIQLDVMDTRNACSTYNLLSEEGRKVAACSPPSEAAQVAENYYRLIHVKKLMSSSFHPQWTYYEPPSKSICTDHIVVDCVNRNALLRFLIGFVSPIVPFSSFLCSCCG
ncbi:hypothetical protein F5887DRAFT_168744 [Amanita rubescens]|nr:hypothetical protein F5887DRAFT_168744 [Amanita rubescens]